MNYGEYRNDEVRSAVYNALAQISFKLNASEEEMNQAIEWFQIKFYEGE